MKSRTLGTGRPPCSSTCGPCCPLVSDMQGTVLVAATESLGSWGLHSRNLLHKSQLKQRDFSLEMSSQERLLPLRPLPVAEYNENSSIAFQSIS